MITDFGWQMRKFLIPAFCLLCLICTDAVAGTWRSLTPVQQEALAPLAPEWDRLPAQQQQRLLKTSKHYPQLNSEQKQRFHERLVEWSKLTPQQREAARKKYRAFSNVPEEHRDQVKRMVKEDKAKKVEESRSGESKTEGLKAEEQ